MLEKEKWGEWGGGVGSGGQVCVHTAEKVLRWEEGFVPMAAGSENSKTSVVMWPEGRRKEERIGRPEKGRSLEGKNEH